MKNWLFQFALGDSATTVVKMQPDTSRRIMQGSAGQGRVLHCIRHGLVYNPYNPGLCKQIDHV